MFQKHCSDASPKYTTVDNRSLIRSGEARLVGWSRQMLYSGFNIFPRSVFWSADFNGRSDNLDVMSLAAINKMRFTTSNILLLVSFVAVCLGWAVDRNSLCRWYDQDIATKNEEINVMRSSRLVHDEARVYGVSPTPELDRLLYDAVDKAERDHATLQKLLSVYKNLDSIDNEKLAAQYVTDAMLKLNCRTFSDLRHYVQNEELGLEMITDARHPEHLDFSIFITMAQELNQTQ